MTTQSFTVCTASKYIDLLGRHSEFFQVFLQNTNEKAFLASTPCYRCFLHSPGVAFSVGGALLLSLQGFPCGLEQISLEERKGAW